MKNIFICLLLLLLVSCGGTSATSESAPLESTLKNQKKEISALLDQWHEAAGNADFKAYFSKMAKDAVFIGTDPTENWHKSQFMEWSKPYFDRGKAWNFTSLERNIFTSKADEIVWFDELLETQMGICRGSGVMVREKDQWKIEHYVLSLTIPNDKVSEVTQIKQEFDNNLISKTKLK